MKLLTTISRYFVGVLFIFSGLIKANDPLGFAYKLQEFFDVFGQYPVLNIFDSPFWHGLVLEMSIMICIVEVVLGIALLLGAYTRIVSWILLLMMIFFTFLTGFAAITGQITECGCFGDAIPLSTMQSFYKDLILTTMVLIIFFGRQYIRPVFKKKRNSDIALGAGVLLTVIFTLNAYHHLPYIDFRPYAEGNDICALREEIPDELEFSYILKNKKSGEEKSFKAFPENYKEEWEYVRSETKVLKKGKAAVVQNFLLSDADGNDLTEIFLANEGYKFMAVMYDLEKTKTSRLDKLSELAADAEKAGIPFYGVSASPNSMIEDFRFEHQLAFPFLLSDETELKTMIRANPGLILWKGCKIVKKWHWRDLPDFEKAKKKYMD